MGGAQSIFQGRPREICVIGAGVSGLRAAGLLPKAGFKVTVLEARDRIGGRIQQSDWFGILIDLGASWIHGTRGNPLVDLAKMEKVVTVVDCICDGKGNWLSRDSARLLYEEVWEILEMAMETSREGSVTPSDTATMMEYFRQEVGRRRVQREDPEEYVA
jgi:phytoene dehydrogenase-like protein